MCILGISSVSILTERISPLGQREAQSRLFLYMHRAKKHVDLVQKSLACKLLSNISLDQRLALKSLFPPAPFLEFSLQGGST